MNILRIYVPVIVLALSAAVSPVSALDKLIVIPTARTIGATYQVELAHKEPLLNASALSLDVGVKAGLGQRALVEAKVPVSASSHAVLFFGKYTFAVTRGSLTAVAVGVENVGADSLPIPYLAASHLFKTLDFTVGVGSGANEVAKYFTGVDYRIGSKWHLLGDYNTGSTTYASLGFQYNFSRTWYVKSGWQANHGTADEALIKIAYCGAY